MSINANVPNEIRRAIYRRDGYACALCGNPRFLAIHHVVPRGEGGGNMPQNLITLCRNCHALAHGTNLNPEEWNIGPEQMADVVQGCVEYVSDMYAGRWTPFRTINYKNPEVVAMTLFDIRETIEGRW